MTSFRGDDRAVSVAVTHVLATGIVTILLSGLLITAGNVLDNQQRSTARDQLDTIGDRVSAEISSLDRAATPGGDERITVDTTHPSRVSGATYTVRLRTGPDCSGPLIDDSTTDACLVLSTSMLSDDRVVPVDVDPSKVDPGSASGGDIRIVYDSTGSTPTITIESQP
ncbi:DUF7266 family protein [Halostella litorea]|uniref:DUF7266 family protein n=1 Tax=Halostella litorea TaxID=2528831 RepID=UPI001092774A|nr:hypothetical protein [Halostella litorea]